MRYEENIQAEDGVMLLTVSASYSGLKDMLRSQWAGLYSQNLQKDAAGDCILSLDVEEVTNTVVLALYDLMKAVLEQNPEAHVVVVGYPQTEPDLNRLRSVGLTYLVHLVQDQDIAEAKKLMGHLKMRARERTEFLEKFGKLFEKLISKS